MSKKIFQEIILVHFLNIMKKKILPTSFNGNLITK